MKTYELIAPCHFGMEAVLKREIINLGYDISEVQNGKLTFIGDADAIARANINLRTAERILLKVGDFEAKTFTELFDNTKQINWEDFIDKNGKIWIKKASSINSKLFSPSDIQSIVKKAIIERIKGKYNIEYFKEDGNEYPIRVNILKDRVTIGIDTSGNSLHKRGYRKLISKAPITETLAAALIMLTPWNKDRILIDPFCGCGTIPIEAAMIGANIAPGLDRDFVSQTWEHIITKKYWYNAIEEANDLIKKDVKMNIQGYDIDENIISSARKNASLAQVDHLIHFQARQVKDLSSSKKYGFIITNPPYGERIEEKENLPLLYKQIGDTFKSLDTWSYYIITSYDDIEKYIGRKANKNRKIYNGMMKTYYYTFSGPRPPKKEGI